MDDAPLRRTVTGPNGLVLRPARESDLPAIIALLVDDPLGKTRERLENPLPPVYSDALRAMEAQGGNIYLLAEREDVLLGCLQLTLIPGISREGSTRAQVEGVRVAQAARGQGLGERLMREAIERSKDAGATLMQLTTDHRRADAHRFYERLGFVGSHLGMKLTLD